LRPCAPRLDMNASRLALGTAQFGLRYGVANASGQVALDEVAAILQYGQQSGVRTLDTAIDYGDAESRLGSIGVRQWLVNSKLPPIPAECRSIEDWVIAETAASLQRLQIERLNMLLLHRPQQLLEARGAALYAALDRLKARGWVAGIGVSVYAPEELDALCLRYRFDAVQVPLNVVDRSFVTSGWLERLRREGIEVQVRSVFLQGLLLMKDRPAYFDRWAALWRRWQAWLEQQSISAVEACIRYVSSVSGVDRLVIGVDSRAQLAQVAAALRAPAIDPPADLASTDTELVHPSRWARPT
jgi:aryl-alcohol dehydrogenase-like predicted oxidoreductase